MGFLWILVNMKMSHFYLSPWIFSMFIKAK